MKTGTAWYKFTACAVMADEEPEGHCGGRLSPLDSMQALKEIRKTDAAYNAPKARGKEDGR